MARKTKIPPPDALLCERCGYDLAGLRRADDCPECGKAVEESIRSLLQPFDFERDSYDRVLPDFQTFRRWWRSAVTPFRSWDGIQINRSLADATRIQSLITASVVFFITSFLVTGPSMFELGLFGPLMLAVPTVFLLMLLTCLCWVESLGIRFFGGRRGWRITKDVAAFIVSHAAFAWILCAAGLGVFVGLTLANTFPMRKFVGPFDILYVGLFLAILPGLLWFETLVWIGVRRLRYANIPGSERHLADSQNAVGQASRLSGTDEDTGGTPVPPSGAVAHPDNDR